MRPAPVLLAAVMLAAAVSGPVAATGQTDTVTLTVTVVGKTGDTVGGVTLNATWDGGSNTVTTASNGKAFLDVPEGADVRIYVEDETYVRNFPKIVENAEEGDVTIEATRKGSIELTVTDKDGVVANASVTVSRNDRTIASGKTDENGVFEVGPIERREYQVTLSKSGYYRNETSVVVTGDILREIRMVRGAVNVEITVKDDHFSPPKDVSDARVTVESIGTQRTTSGTVTFTVPVNNNYQVNVTKQGYETASRTLNVRESSRQLTLTIQRERALVVKPVNDRVVVGETTLVKVVNAYDEPVAGAQVRLDGEMVGETNENGEIRVTIKSAGKHTIRARSGSIQSAGVVVTGIEPNDETPTNSPTASPTDSPTASPTDSPTPTTQTPLPGFGPVAALAALALAGAALLVRRR